MRMLLLGIFLSGSVSLAAQPAIDVWYGEEQYFGYPARAQNWINVLGNVSPLKEISEVSYRLNGGDEMLLTLGSDLHRLARAGDFNIELGWDVVREGRNSLVIMAKNKSGLVSFRNIALQIEKGNDWPLPYFLDFTQVEQLQRVAQVVDGKWELTRDGVRTAEPYYDRVLSMGDSSWVNYEVRLVLTIHDYTPPEPGPPTYDVSHFGVALRWRGHVPDNRQPNRQWYPLGAQGELLLRADGDSCRWRVLRGGGEQWMPVPFSNYRAIELGKRLQVRAQVQSLPEGQHVYRFKLWDAGKTEPEEWDVEAHEDSHRDFESGAFCIVPHNSDVTVHLVEAIPLE